MSVLDKLTSLQGTVEDIRQSIVSKDVPVTTTDGFKVYPDAVRAINFQDYTNTALKPTIHGVNYYDYNGDLLYVYTPQEFLALSAHPSQPTHTGLVADGWNWDLTDAQTFIRNTCDCLNIGGHYNTSSGKTEIYFTLDADSPDWLSFPLYYRCKRTASTYSMLIEWWDGTTTGITSGINTSFADKSSWPSTSSTAPGSYCIKVTGTNIIYVVGNSASYNGVFGYTYTQSRCRAAELDKIYFGDNSQVTSGQFGRWAARLEEVSCPKANYSIRNTDIQEYTFLLCSNLKGFVIPEGVLTIEQYAFQNNLKIRCVCLPKSTGTTIGQYAFQYSWHLDSIIVAAACTSIGQYAFASLRARRIFINGTLTAIPNYCFNNDVLLEEITIPSTVVTLGTSAFYECLSLKHLEFGELTSVGQNCFNYCSSLKTIVFHAETPPTAGATPFGNCTSLEKIYVPYSEDHSILNAYKVATNWTTYASKIFELDENGNIPT